MVEIYIPFGTDVSLLQDINRTLRSFPGNMQVVLLLASGDQIKRMNLPFSIAPEPTLQKSIEQLLGEESFKIV